MKRIYCFFRLYQDLFKHAIPCIIAILISGIIDVEVSLNHPLGGIIDTLISEPSLQLTIKRISWYFIQLIPAFIFGILSDHHLRKKTLIYSQIFGVVGSIFLLFYKFDFWIVLFLGLTFNPVSVARAALLDNYQNLSALKVIAITFMAKNLSWLFISVFSKVSFETVLLFVLPVISLNIVLIAICFNDKFESKLKLSRFKKLEEKKQKKSIKFHRGAIFLTLFAFSLSETTFYSFWSFLETSVSLEQWLFIATLGTYLGTSFTLFYRKIPHPSLIAILYLIGAATSAIALIYSVKFGVPYSKSLLFSMIQYCVVGGIYLPFVADVIIQLSGTFRKATGSAIYEVGDMLALFLAGTAAFLILKSPMLILIMNTSLYLSATIIQKVAEKKSNKFDIK